MSTTLLPFLYQTRTIQRLARSRVPSPALRAFFHATTSPADQHQARRLRENAIPFEFPEGMEHPDLDFDDAEIEHNATITPSEQRVFHNIFREIAAKGIQPRVSSKPSVVSGDATRPSALLAPDHRVPGDNGVNIVQNSCSPQGSQRQSFHPPQILGQDTQATLPDEAIMRFPPSLRRAARSAQSILEADSADIAILGDVHTHGASTSGRESTGSNEEGKVTSQLHDAVAAAEAKLAPERSRVEGKMRTAQTDFELWDVLEEEVFPIVKKLDIDGQEKQSKKKKRRGKKALAKTNADATEDVAQQSQLAMDTHGRLYSSYLITAVQLMDQSFARSSPLALNILPRVKELGLTSYVLGASTPFYNALAEVYWRRYGNVEAVLSLLKEMRHAGLQSDGQTLAVVDSIRTSLAAATSDEAGPFLRELASLPEYQLSVRPEIAQWSRRITAKLHEEGP